MDMNTLQYVVGEAKAGQPAVIRFFGRVTEETTSRFNDEFDFLGVGDTVTLPIQVEVYDGNAARPQINLSSYLVYLQAGSEFDPNSYLTQIKEYDKVKQVVFSENVADPDNQISITQIYVESGVDIYTPGVYTVSYLYTSPASGLDCTAKTDCGC